jgi:hypothetical protein
LLSPRRGSTLARVCGRFDEKRPFRNRSRSIDSHDSPLAATPSQIGPASFRRRAALRLGLALIATLAQIGLRVATAKAAIVAGTIAQLIIGAALGSALWPQGEPATHQTVGGW